MKIQYKNETDGIVNIRGKKLRPGDSIVSRVFIKHFEEEVKDGKLTVYIDGIKIGFEQAPAAEEQIANSDPLGDEISDLTETDEPVFSTETETSEVPAEISAEEIETDEPEVSSEQQEEETPAEIAEDPAEVQDGTEQESGVDTPSENAESVTGDTELEDEAVGDVQGEETVSEAEISAEETSDSETGKAE